MSVAGDDPIRFTQIYESCTWPEIGRAYVSKVSRTAFYVEKN